MARSSATRSKGCTTLARIRYIVAEAYRGFRRNLLLAGSMVIIVAISLTLFGIALLAGKQVNLWGGYWSDKIEVSVFLAKGITSQQRGSVGSQIRELPGEAPRPQPVRPGPRPVLLRQDRLARQGDLQRGDRLRGRPAQTGGAAVRHPEPGEDLLLRAV